MKIVNWCRRLSAALVASGLLLPCAASAAALNANLVANPGFEDVDTTVTCCFGAVKLNGWADGSRTGFAYNYNLNYDNGGPLAGGGTYYFTPNAEGDGDNITIPGQVAQIINLAVGPTAVGISSGQARFQLSAFFSSYLDERDFGSVQLEFLDSSMPPTPVGPPIVISDNDTSTWTQVATSGHVPSTASAARISVFGTPRVIGPDGYIDNVDLRIVVVPEPATVILGGLSVVGARLMLRRRQHGS